MPKLTIEQLIGALNQADWKSQSHATKLGPTPICDIVDGEDVVVGVDINMAVSKTSTATFNGEPLKIIYTEGVSYVEADPSDFDSTTDHSGKTWAFDFTVTDAHDNELDEQAIAAIILDSDQVATGDRFNSINYHDLLPESDNEETAGPK
jgi:hypothetical protein